MHYGQDFSLPKGTPVYATANGRVSIEIFIWWFGKYIYIDHGNGYKTVYAHLDKFNVKRGQRVKGELIAYSGNSEDQLHRIYITKYIKMVKKLIQLTFSLMI